MNALTALILAGGRGTRLASIVKDVPKVLAPINGKPFIHYLVSHLQKYGIKRIILCLGYKAECVYEHFSLNPVDIDIVFSTESTPLGTAGALKNALPLIENDQTLICNGDSFFRTNLIDFVQVHMKQNNDLSMLLWYADDCSRYGTVRVDHAGLILSFEEKKGRAISGYINSGVYCMSKKRIESIPSGREISLEKDCFPQWIGTSFYGIVQPGTFIDIGTPQSYEYAQYFFQ